MPSAFCVVSTAVEATELPEREEPADLSLYGAAEFCLWDAWDDQTNYQRNLSTGEVEVARDDVRGIAVHIGARVAGLADAGEVLVSQTVRDLVAGAGLELAERGEHDLKGVPGAWRVYAVV